MPLNLLLPLTLLLAVPEASPLEVSTREGAGGPLTVPVPQLELDGNATVPLPGGEGLLCPLTEAAKLGEDTAEAEAQREIEGIGDGVLLCAGDRVAGADAQEVKLKRGDLLALAHNVGAREELPLLVEEPSI